MLEPITTVVILTAPLSSSNVPPLPSESPSSKEAVAVGLSIAAYASFREKAEVSKNPITNNMIIVVFTHTHSHRNTKALVDKFSEILKNL